MIEMLETIFVWTCSVVILVLDMIGALIIIFYAIRGLIELLSRKGNGRLTINNGVATALTFLLCGEALNTIIAPDWKDIGMTCAILLMRAGMALLIHWESHNEKVHEEQPE